LSLSKRLTALEKIAAYASIHVPATDYKVELIARIEAVVARAEAAGEMPPRSELDYAEDVRQLKETLREHLRRKLGELE
jgi:hypothetical protein